LIKKKNPKGKKGFEKKKRVVQKLPLPQPQKGGEGEERGRPNLLIWPPTPEGKKGKEGKVKTNFFSPWQGGGGRRPTDQKIGKKIKKRKLNNSHKGKKKGMGEDPILFLKTRAEGFFLNVPDDFFKKKRRGRGT